MNTGRGVHFQWYIRHRDYDTPMSRPATSRNGRAAGRRADDEAVVGYVFDRVTGEPIWPMPETPVLQSDVPGERTASTQPIPSKPAPYAQQGLVESDLIDYAPAIRDSALKLARRCRMGPYYIPPSAGDGKSASPAHVRAGRPEAGKSSGAQRPKTGMLYVKRAPAQQDGGSEGSLPEFRYSSPRELRTDRSDTAPGGYCRPRDGGRGRGGGFEGRAAVDHRRLSRS